MLIRQLDRKSADAVCTIIAIGFIAEQSRIEDEYCKTKFQYELPADPVRRKQEIQEHADVSQLIARDARIVVDFEAAETQRNFPFIVAKPPHIDYTPEGVITRAFNRTRAFWDGLEALSHQQGAGPYGAYIGGLIQDNGFVIIGPSNLTTYEPAFKMPTPDDEQHHFDAATNTVKAHSAILELGGFDGIIYNPDQLADCDSLPAGKLFGSVHGMIKTMLRFPDSGDDVHIEYSLAPRTTKVASCIPCSIFMSANGRPASSTHLGRGDNWNFPQPDSNLYPDMEAQKGRWRKSVIQYFNDGRELLGNTMDINPVLRELSDVTKEDNIPQLFLESLTFESSFIKKIVNTLTM